MNRDIRKITDGAMMIAIVGMVLLVNRQFAGLLQDLFIWAFPLPMVFYGAKYGWKDSITVFVSMMLLTFILGTPQTWFYMFSAELIGLIYGCGVHHKISTRTLLFVTILTSVISNLITMLIFASFFGYDVQAEATEIQAMMNDILATTSGSAMAAQSFDLSNMLMTIVVVGIILNGVLGGYVTHLLSNVLLKRLRFDVPPVQSILTYYPPKWTGYVGLLGVIVYFYSVANTLDNVVLQNIIFGVSLALVIYLCIFGYFALLLIFTKVFKAKALAVFIAMFATVAASVFVAALGFMYIVGDLHNQLLEKGE